MKKGKLAGAMALVSAIGVVAVAPAGAGVHATAASQAAFCDPMSTAGRARVRRLGHRRERDRRPRRRGPRARSLADARGHAREREGQGGPELQGHDPGLLPRRHRRGDRRAHRRADRGADRGAQQHVLRRARAARRPGFSFKLAGITRTDNAGWFYTNPGGTDEHSMKQALKQGGDNALNLYSTTAGDYLGWAYLPDITDEARPAGTSTASSSTGSRSRARRPRTPAATTRARRPRTRSATG